MITWLIIVCWIDTRCTYDYVYATSQESAETYARVLISHEDYTSLNIVRVTP